MVVFRRNAKSVKVIFSLPCFIYSIFNLKSVKTVFKGTISKKKCSDDSKFHFLNYLIRSSVGRTIVDVVSFPLDIKFANYQQKNLLDANNEMAFWLLTLSFSVELDLR